MSRSQAASSGARLGEILVREGRIQPDQLRRALEMQQLIGGRLGTNLLEIGAVDESTLLSALGAQRATCTVGAEELTRLDPELLRMLPSKLARRYRLVPYRLKGKTLYVASADPGDALREDEISFLTSSMVRTCIGLELRIQLALQRGYRQKIDARYVHVAKRLAEGQAGSGSRESRDRSGTGGWPVAAPSLAPPSAQTVAPTTAPTAPSAARSPSAVETTETAAVERSVRAVRSRRAPRPSSTEVEFIELDTDDLALLRRDSPPSGKAAVVSSVPEEVAVAVGTPSPDAVASDDDIEPPTEELADEVDLAELPTDERLRTAARRLQEADIRDEIGDVLIEFAAADFRRRLLLIDRKGEIVGWQGAGDGVDERSVREVTVDARLPSVFSSLRDASSFWLGPLAPMPENQKLIAVLGAAPRECIVLPVALRGKIVCYLYGDNAGDGVAGIDLEPLRRLVRKAGVAFEVYILKHKIRTL